MERRAALHQQGSSLTPIPSDLELSDAVLKELGLRRKLGTSQDEVCATLFKYCKTKLKQTKLEFAVAFPRSGHSFFFPD